MGVVVVTGASAGVGRATAVAFGRAGNRVGLIARGPDGLEVIRGLIAGAGARLRPEGRLAIEIGHGQQDAVLDLVRAAGNLASASVLKDHEGLWRVLVAEAAPQSSFSSATGPGIRAGPGPGTS